ncbi:MAG: matrixin family metalloprotease [Labilithrix sp.]|nr:matrixin family metalloprotease [Labilithrix sp.]
MNRVAGWGLMAMGLGGCFAGYDSRWGQSAAVQRQHAAEHAPTLRGERSEDEARTPAKAMRVRAYVARAYAAQVVDVSATLRELFADVNDVTEPSLGVKLTLEGIRTWDLPKDDDLSKVIAELRSADPATEVDWVAGFVGAFSRATASFHDLGYGEQPGRYVVVRAPSSAMAHESVEKSYRELSEEERQRLQKDHRRHRAAAVFLHEIGHTLGGIHERSERNLMYPEYRSKMTTFNPDTVDIMRGTVGRRDVKTLDDQIVLFRELAAGIRRAPPGTFFDEERQKTLAQLDDFVAQGEARAKAHAASAAPAAAPAPAAEPDPPELSAEDKARWSKVRDALNKNDFVAAWETAKPLFATYRDVMAVQELRCNVATKVFKFDVARKECERMMQLSTGKP